MPSAKAGIEFKIIYFKRNGKFYTDTTATWDIRLCDGGNTVCMSDACAKLRGLRDNGGPNALPGLCGEGWDGFILIDAENGYPCLIIPEITDALS